MRPSFSLFLLLGKHTVHLIDLRMVGFVPKTRLDLLFPITPINVLGIKQGSSMNVDWEIMRHLKWSLLQKSRTQAITGDIGA